MPDDAHLIDAARAGCSASFRALIDRHGAALFRLLRRLCRGRSQDAEDLYQEALLRISRGLTGFQATGSVAGWMCSIGRNVWIDQARRRRLDEAPLCEETLLAPGAHPSAELEARQLGARIQEAVDQLTPKQREVFLLRHYAGLSFKEIAGVLECPLGTALARMSYAVRALRPHLADLRGPRARGPDPRPESSAGGEGTPLDLHRIPWIPALQEVS